jgi:hypothetical protein
MKCITSRFSRRMARSGLTRSMAVDLAPDPGREHEITGN